MPLPDGAMLADDGFEPEDDALEVDRKFDEAGRWFNGLQTHKKVEAAEIVPVVDLGGLDCRQS